MRCCRSGPDFLLALLFSLWLSVAGAADAEVHNPQLQLGDEGYVLSADLPVELNPRLEEAVARGVTLYFVVEFELSRYRWYWLDERIASRSLTLRLSYHALTRQYRLSSGALHQSFSSLDEALRVLSRLRSWPVLERSVALKPGETVQAALRFRLDVSQLPKPFQLTALANREWNLSSDWARWNFTVPEVRETK